jgi:hypothetical protein
MVDASMLAKFERRKVPRAKRNERGKVRAEHRRRQEQRKLAAGLSQAISYQLSAIEAIGKALV